MDNASSIPAFALVARRTEQLVSPDVTVIDEGQRLVVVVASVVELVYVAAWRRSTDGLEMVPLATRLACLSEGWAILSAMLAAAVTALTVSAATDVLVADALVALLHSGFTRLTVRVPVLSTR